MADATSPLLDKKSFVVIAGASRGLGKSIATKLVTELPRTSFFLFLARNNATLEALAGDLMTSHPGVRIGWRKFDQGILEQNIFDTLLVDVLKEYELKVDDFEQSVIVHNCATVGDVSKWAWEMTEVTPLQKFFEINVTGMILLNSAFLKTFGKTKSRLVVNITSDNSKIPYPSMSVYCASKAARDMFFRVMVAEDPSIRVLSYSPGPCDTDLLAYTRDTCTSKDLGGDLKNFYSEGKVLSCDTSIDKLIAFLKKNTFKNAEYVEYYDPL
ncbi:sepiapterin reductase-like [Argopecten irradians]|uniref:sepiapterin reductase-like n=1 Tax=Argopecten irradians TaxID=31199 RepID=UPI003716455C